jgi:hypothetical protein
MYLEKKTKAIVSQSRQAREGRQDPWDFKPELQGFLGALCGFARDALFVPACRVRL